MPAPVGPTTATVRPAATSRWTSRRSARSPPPGRPTVRPTSRARRGRRRAAGAQGAVAGRELAVRVEHARDPVVADQRARHLAEHPAEGPHGEGEQGEQVGGGDDVAGLDVPRADLHVPTTRTSSVPRLGSRSITGSKNARTMPTRTLASRSCVARAGEPGLLARLRAERLDEHGGLEALVRDVGDLGTQLLRADRRGRHAALEHEVRDDGERAARRARRSRATRRCGRARRPRRRACATPSANGRGLKTLVAASTSALAFDSSWPVGCCRCHDIGRRRYWRVTAGRWSSWIRAKPRPGEDASERDRDREGDRDERDPAPARQIGRAHAPARRARGRRPRR